MSVKIYLNSDNGLVIEEANGVIYNRTQGDLSAKSENGRIEFSYSASGASFKDYAILDVVNSLGVSYGSYASIISAISDFFVDAALAAAEQLEVVSVLKNGGSFDNLINKIISTTNIIPSGFSSLGMTPLTTFMWVNKNLVASQDSTVKRIYGKFQSGLVTIYIVNAAKTELRTVGTFTAIDGINDITGLNIPIYSGESITTDRFYYNNTSVLSTKYTFSGTVISSAADFSAELALQITFEYVQTVTLEKGVAQTLADLETQMIGKNKYVVLHNSLSDYTLSGFSLLNGKLSSSTSGDYCFLNKIYHSDKRYIRIDAIIASNSIIKIPINVGGISASGVGASCFGIDLANKKIIIYSVGNGTENQGNSFGYTTTELNSAAISSDGYLGTDYIIEIHKNGLSNKLILMNKLSGVETVVEHIGWGAGRQNHNYYIQNVQGSITINSSTICNIFQPDVVFVGDSITEGLGVIDRTQRYAELFRTNNPLQSVVISALSGDTIDGVLAKFSTEYNIYKPKKMSVLIGTNDVDWSLYKLQLLKANCDAIGCKLFLNNIVCNGSGDLHIAKNSLIVSMGLPGAKFDVATAIAYFPLVDGTHSSPRYNTSIYYDAGTHPNILGNAKMYERLAIDIPELFK